MAQIFAFLHIFSWSDCIEILFFSFIIFKFSCWLRQDHRSNLLSYFYLGTTGFILAYLFDLAAIKQFYQVSWPIMLTIFIIIHQKSLQKNYVAARTLEPTKYPEQSSWLSLLMSAAFKGLQHKKNLTFVIEGNNALDEFIDKPITVNSPIQESLLSMIIESSLTQSDTIILITHYGKLIGLNCVWQKEIDPLWLDKKYDAYQGWEQEALYWSTNLDALIFQADPNTKRITIIAQGTYVPNLITDKAVTIIEQYLRKNKLPKLSIEKTQSQEGAAS